MTVARRSGLGSEWGNLVGEGIVDCAMSRSGDDVVGVVWLLLR